MHEARSVVARQARMKIELSFRAQALGRIALAVASNAMAPERLI
jgi:hypothetical protein